jgi:hypothetical protein
VKPDPTFIAINRYGAANAELDKISVREATLPNGNPASSFTARNAGLAHRYHQSIESDLALD